MKKSPPSTPTIPRKQLSGAAKRKRAVQREAQRLASSLAERFAASSYPSARSLDDEHVQLPHYGIPPAKYVREVEAVLLTLEQGNFETAGLLSDGMLRDDRIFGTLGVRVGGLLGAPVDLEPARDTARGRAVKEAAEACYAEMFPQHQLEELFRSAMLMGASVAQIIPKRYANRWIPTVKVFHNRFLYFNWGTRKYDLITEDAGIVEIDPADHPGWLVFEPFGPPPFGWLRCLMRPLVSPWLIRTWTRSWWAREREVHGMPIRLGIIPAERDPADERRFLSQLSSLSHEASIRLPQGEEGNRFDVKLLEAVSNTWGGFQALLQHCDDSIAIATLGQRTSTQGAAGLGSDANPGDAVRDDLKRRDAQTLAEALRDQVLKLWAQWNFGDDSLAPYVKYQVDPPEDTKAQAEELLTLMQALQIAPPELDKRAVLERHDQPMLDAAQVPPDVPGTPAPDPVPSDEAGGDDEGGGETDRTNANADDAAPTQLSAAAVLALSDDYGPKVSLAARAGDQYALKLSKASRGAAAAALGPDLARVQRVIAASTSTDDLRERLKDAFKAFDPAGVADVTRKALVLAQLAGRAAVHADTRRKR